MTLRVGDEEVKFNLTKNMRFVDDNKGTCMRIDSLILSINDVLHDMIERDPLEKCLTKSLSLKDLEFEHPSIVQEISKTNLAIDENKSTVVVEKEKKTHDGLVLKELLENLRYAFLGVNGIKPMIISIALNEDMETKLLEALKNNMEAFSWLIEDIKGISPLVCMHNILMENGYTPIVEHQRQLNPAMKEFVKKEVLKWLHVGFIYAISNNSWVSLV